MTAYQKYQLQWMIDHDCSLDDLIAGMTQYQVDCKEFGRVDEIFNEWVYNVGFGGQYGSGEIWACYDEWKDCEGVDEE